MNEILINQESSTASDFEFPCKPLLGPSPKLMQPQPSLRVVQGSIMWHQHMRGACGRWKWEVLGRRGHSEAKIALAVPAWHRTEFHCLDDKIRSHEFGNTPSFTKRRSVPYSQYRTVWLYKHKPEHTVDPRSLRILIYIWQKTVPQRWASLIWEWFSLPA